MRLYLIRHGETDWLSQGKLQGRADVALNERGRKQAQMVASFIKGLGTERLISSTLRRAKETAYYIAMECGLSFQEDPRLDEIFFGDWEGQPVDEIQTQYPNLYQSWIELKESFQAPQGESVKEVRERIRSFFDDIHTREETVVAVSHGGPIRLLVLEILKVPLHGFRSIRMDPASVVLIENDHGSWCIAGVNPKNGEHFSLQQEGGLKRDQFMGEGYNERAS